MQIKLNKTVAENKPNLATQSLDTIVALATPPGKSGVAIVRISGSKVQSMFLKLFAQELKPRQANYVAFLDEDDQVLDRGIAIFFSAPNSFTGEDVLELQGHGGPVIIDLLINRVLALGARLARPGEFSERAFLNNKIDLAQAEGVFDLIHATSKEAARSALRSMSGEFSQLINAINEKIVHLRMYVEAAIDFSDQEINFLTDTKIKQMANEILQQLQSIQYEAKQGSILREGIAIVLVGKPNVGKSSLLNQLSGQDIAIVTPQPGTTRDVLREMINLDGIPIKIIDTAGLHDSLDLIEQEGMRRTHQEIKLADILFYLSDVTDKAPNALHDLNNQFDGPVVYIHNKIDLINQASNIEIHAEHAHVYLSAKTGEGIACLKKHIKTLMGFQSENNSIFLARRRHLNALSQAQQHLKDFMQVAKGHPPELAAYDIHLAHQALAEITGTFTSNDLLGEIFASFCIGK